MKARIAVAGVGNCSAVLLQGLGRYSSGAANGLWHPTVAGMKVRDVELVAAFDIDARKVGRRLHEAALAPPNVAKRFADVESSKISVSPGISAGDIAPNLRSEKVVTADRRQIVERLEDADAEILLNLISSGSDRSSEVYAEAALEAGCAFINCTPTLVLRRRGVATSYSRAKLPLIGDDLMSQFGGTVFHKGLLSLMVNRGIKIGQSYQLDVGGGSETLNTIDEGIKMAKRKVKTSSVAAEVPYKFETIAGTTDYVDYMANDRTSYFWAQGSGFLDSDVTVDVYLRTSDGANAGNVLLDVVRAARMVMKTKRLAKAGVISGYGFKSPPRQVHFEEALEGFEEEFVR